MVTNVPNSPKLSDGGTMFKDKPLFFAVLTTLILLVAFDIGCANRAATAGVPAAPVTVMEQVAQNNAEAATLNHIVEQGIVEANRLGVLSDANTQPALVLNFKIAAFDKQITIILQSVATDADKATQIKAVIAQLKVTANSMIANGSLNIKNPKSQQTIQADVQAVLSLADGIVSSLQSGGF